MNQPPQQDGVPRILWIYTPSQDTLDGFPTKDVTIKKVPVTGWGGRSKGYFFYRLGILVRS